MKLIIAFITFLLTSSLHAQHNHNHSLYITDKYVIVHGDVIPRFAVPYSNIAIRDGNWSDPSTWNNNKIPGKDSRVNIPAGINVKYNISSETQLDAIEINGALEFSTDINTALYLNEIMVMPSGILTIGNEQNQIAANVKSEIVFTDTPTLNGIYHKAGTKEKPGIDPQQWGKGLIVFGKLQIHGAPKSSSYQQVIIEPRAGDMSLKLKDVPIGWQPGDQIIVPDTDANWKENRIEELVVKQINGSSITFNKPLNYNHRVARDAENNIVAYPHIGNLSRNVIIRSQNPEGIRGHTVYFGSANIDIRYARFSGLGRTTLADLDNSLVKYENNNLSVFSIGKNQIGRYSVHFHHVEGPHNASNSGYQFKVIGNSIDNGKRWGVVVHGSNYGDISDNFAYNIPGPSFVTEDGSESYNRFNNNFSVRNGSTGFFKSGLAGEGFWFRGPLNQITNNVAANSRRAGFDIFVQNLPKNTPKPKFRGANKADINESVPVNPGELPFLGFENNIAYGSNSGFDNWSSSPKERSYVKNLLIWHTNDNSFAISSYINENISFENINIFGDFQSLNNKRPQKHQAIPEDGIQAVRQSSNLIIKNSTFKGVQTAINTPTYKAEKMLVADSTLQAYVGIKVGRLTAGGPTSISKELEYGSLTVSNTKFIPMPHNIVEPAQYTLFLDYGPVFKTAANLMNKNEVYLFDFNGTKGANYRVFYPEQAPDFVVPKSVIDLSDRRKDFIASPEAGLTNRQAWDKYKIAIGGAVAPCREFDNDNCEAAWRRAKALGIHGLVFPLQANSYDLLINAGQDLIVKKNQTIGLSAKVDKNVVVDWSKLNGPGEAIFSNFKLYNSNVTFSEPGQYVLRLTGNLNAKRSFDELNINVLP